jgi:hypothetical protein
MIAGWACKRLKVVWLGPVSRWPSQLGRALPQPDASESGANWRSASWVREAAASADWPDARGQGFRGERRRRARGGGSSPDGPLSFWFGHRSSGMAFRGAALR